LVSYSPPLGHYFYYITGSKESLVIFAVLYVSLNIGLNGDKSSQVFYINICCFSTRLHFFVPRWHIDSSKFHQNCSISTPP